ncbi:hypothetical protein EBS02_11745, partial [bacterium]|nr:hypothetical protein [bacterium]
TAVLKPILSFQTELDSDKNLVKRYVVPEPSEREITEIGRLGRFAVGFNSLIRALGFLGSLEYEPSGTL